LTKTPHPVRILQTCESYRACGLQQLPGELRNNSVAFFSGGGSVPLVRRSHKIGERLGTQRLAPIRERGLILVRQKPQPQASSALCRTMLAVQKVRPQCRSLPFAVQGQYLYLELSAARRRTRRCAFNCICSVRHSRYFVGTQSPSGDPPLAKAESELKFFDAAWQPRPPNSATPPTTPPLLTRQRLLSRFLPRPSSSSSSSPSTNSHR
jgi:hypothetical protein